jgi:hypothetical protein
MKYALAAAMFFAVTTAYANDKLSAKKMTDAQLDQVVAGVVIPAAGIATAASAGGQTTNAARGLATAETRSGAERGGGRPTN